jgi:hypothetical protein
MKTTSENVLRCRLIASVTKPKHEIPLCYTHHPDNHSPSLSFCIPKVHTRILQELSLQPPAHTGSSLADFSTLKMEAIRSSETSVHTRPTRRYIPEDGILHSHRREILKSYKIVTVSEQRTCVVSASLIKEMHGGSLSVIDPA